MSITYEMVAATDRGLVREINEDSLRIMPDYGLALVADGMGGHKAGDIASRMAVNSVCDYVIEQALIRTQTGADYSCDVLEDAFSLANSEIYANSHQISDCEGMGTTLVAGTFHENLACFGHIGDSRVYQFSHGDLKQLTIDHTLATELAVDTPAWDLPAYSHHVLRKAMGIESNCAPDFFMVEPEANEIYLMCSDGLTGVVSDADIKNILSLRSQNPEACLDTMIHACLENGAPDNVSAVLVYVK